MGLAVRPGGLAPRVARVSTTSPRAGPCATVVGVALRLVVADDNFLVREGLAALLAEVEEIEVVAMATDTPSLIRAVEETSPDAVLTDIRMPPTYTNEGIEAAKRIRAEHPDVGVVVLSQYVEEDYAFELLVDGVTGLGYLLKERVSDVDELVRALHEVSRGGSVLDPKVVEALVARKGAGDGPLAGLTDREREVLAGDGDRSQQRHHRHDVVHERAGRGEAHRRGVPEAGAGRRARHEPARDGGPRLPGGQRPHPTRPVPMRTGRPVPARDGSRDRHRRARWSSCSASTSLVVLGGGVLIGRTDSPSPALSVLATTVVALAFAPVQSALERAASADAATPYDVLTRFAESGGDQTVTEDLPGPHVATARAGNGRAVGAGLAPGVRPPGHGRTLAARMPRPTSVVGPRTVLRSSPVRYGDQVLGELRLQERPGLPLTAVEERLFADLASQAGLVLRLVGLRAELEDRHRRAQARTHELESSRGRVIEAQDAERSRLERDIHDGAQQHLVALAVNLRLAQVVAAGHLGGRTRCWPSRPTRPDSPSTPCPR